ncbi:MAG: chemotaxis protein CheC [Pseudomonadota bacterium]
MNEPPALSELEHDLLSELFNLGVGKAASSLSEMVNQEVILSVPIVEFRNRAGLVQKLGTNQTICSVSQNMEGPFSGKSMLLLPAASGFKVVRSMLGQSFSDEMLTELQPDALSEIGNIILNAFIGAMSDATSGEFQLSLPEFDLCNPNEILQSTTALDDVVLLVRISMKLSESDVIGYLAFTLNDISLQELRTTLEEMFKKMSV